MHHLHGSNDRLSCTAFYQSSLGLLSMALVSNHLRSLSANGSRVPDVGGGPITFIGVAGRLGKNSIPFSVGIRY